MRDEMKRTMFELFGVGSEDDKVLAAGGKKPAVKPEPVKTAPVQAPPAERATARRPISVSLRWRNRRRGNEKPKKPRRRIGR